MIALGLILACGGWKQNVKEGDDWMARENPGAAVRAYGKAVDARPDDPELRLKLAQALVVDGEYERSLEHSALALEADLPGAGMVRASALLNLGRADESLELLKRQAVGTSDPEVQRLMAEAELMRGDLTASGHWLREATRESGDPRALAAQAYVAARLGDTESIGTLMPLARSWYEPPPTACADLGAAWLAAGQSGGANAAAELVLAVDPGARQTGGLHDRWRDEARRAAGTANWEGALRSGLRALTLDRDDGELTWAVATWYASLGEWSAATTWAETALTLEPYRAPEQSGSVAAAASAADSTLTPEARTLARREIAALLAQGYRALGQPTGELRAHELLISSGASENEVLLRMAELLIGQGRPAEAIRVAMEAHRRGAPEAARLAAIAFRDDGDLENAVGWAAEAWSAAPGDPDVALLLADMHSEEQRYDEALQVLQMAIGLNPDNRALQKARHEIVERAN